MLVLSRKHQQSVVVVGADGTAPLLKVTVLEIRGSSVRLGFDVSAEVPVHRAEIWERILAENSMPSLSPDGEKPSLRIPNGDLGAGEETVR